MKKINLLFRILGGLYKSIYINFKVLPFFKAVKLPILVSYHTQLSGISKNTIEINLPELHTGMISIGIFERSEGIIGPKKCYLGTDKHSKIIFEGDFSMVCGGCLKASGGGVLKIGHKVTFNTHSKVLCSHKIDIGNNVRFGWNVTLKDGDGHPIKDEDGQVINSSKGIFVGNNVWVGAEVTILKGACISNGCVVGYRSLVTKSFDEENAIIAGSPAKILKHNITWSEK